VSYSIAGLPLHPLLVHATVVIVPAAAMSVLLAALWPRFRRWAGMLPLGLAVVGLILDPLSTASGESLEHQVGESALIEKHSELADGLLPWMIVLVVTAAAQYWWNWRQNRRELRERASSRAWVPVVISVLAVVAALGSSVQVVLIGHSGAKAAWSDVSSQSAGTRPASK
jgi:predicted membrane protein DUF2231